MTGPISPSDVATHKGRVIPEEIFRIFNDAIALKFDNGYATIKQEDVVQAILSSNITRGGEPIDP